MSFGADNHGSVRLTGDGVVGRSGKPCRVFSTTTLSGGTAGILVLRNGTADTDTIYVQKTNAVVSNTETINWEGGLLFPNGCFFDKDTNVTAVVIEFRNES